MAIRFKKSSKLAAQHGIDLGVLQREKGIADGQNLGGDFRLPEEFDGKKFASAFYKKGGQVEGMKARKILSGTDISADGWSIWLYPEGHENAGKPHEVAVESGTYLLMYRDIEVQKAVNFIFGESSRDRMNAEVHGETVAGSSPEDPGVLTEEALAHVPHLRREREEIQRERERDEQGGRQTTKFEGQRPKGKVITKPRTRIRK